MSISGHIADLLCDYEVDFPRIAVRQEFRPCCRVLHIRSGRSIDEQFSKALDLVGNGHFVFGAENKYLLALRDVLKEAVNDQYDYIDWWLYEATDDYTVWEADCTMKYCLKEPEALYDFITGTLKPVPVSSGESTSQQE